MSVHINDLSSDLLTYLFDFLPDNQIIKIEIVCKKWQNVVFRVLQRKENLNFRRYFMTYKPIRPMLQPSSSWWCIIDHNNIDIFKKIASKCPNIKHLNLRYTRMDGDVLITIAKLCSKLESIVWSKYIDITDEQWDQFTTIISPKLIQWHSDCHASYIDFNKIEMLFQRFKKIEKVSFVTENNEQDKKLFDYLNSCENLNSLKWDLDNRFEEYQFDENMIRVIKRINFLHTKLNTFFRFKQTNMDNLIELTLQPGLVENIPLNLNKQKEVTFYNLKKLTLLSFQEHHLYAINNFKIPKIQYLDVGSSFSRGINFDSTELKPFLDQIKKVNHLIWGSYVTPNAINSFPQLITFQYNYQKIYNEDLSQVFTAMANHKSLNYIKFPIVDIEMNGNIFNDLILLGQSKPNAWFEILTYTFPINSDLWVKCNQYRNRCEQVKRSFNLNIKILDHETEAKQSERKTLLGF